MSGSEKKKLVDFLTSAFSADQLRELTLFELDLNLDNVVAPGSLAARARELVEHIEREGRTPELVQAVVRARPHRIDIQRAYSTDVAAAAASAPTPEAVRDYAKVFGTPPAVTVQKGGGTEAVVTPADPGLQKTIRDDLGFLPAATWSGLNDRMQRRVGRVELNDPRAEMGTGFLVGPDVLLTNYHVVESAIKDPQAAGRVKVRFDYQWLPDGTTADGTLVGLAADWLLASAPYSAGEGKNTPDDPPPGPDDLDYALVRLDRRVGEERLGDGNARGWVELPANQPAANGTQFLMILQHPARRPLELALDTAARAQLVHDDRRLRYRTNTEAGSSGSPVFDQHWKLLALHHYGDPGWKAPAYNQGVPIGLVRGHLARTKVALDALGGSPDALQRLTMTAAAAAAVQAELESGAAPSAGRLAEAAAKATEAVRGMQAGGSVAGLTDRARKVIDEQIEELEDEWAEGMRDPTNVGKKAANKKFLFDLCELLKIARQRNGGDLPPDWQKLWNEHGCK